MNEVLDLTIIIPLDKWDEKVKEYLDRAIDSVALNTLKPYMVIFVTPIGLEDDANEYFTKTKSELETLGIKETLSYSTSKTNFCEQINETVKTLKTKYFSVLEYTDSYGKTWFDNVKRHIELDKDISMFLPIANLYNEETEFIRFYNEQYLAQGFTENDLGFVTEDALKVLWDMNITGGVINKDDFIAVGGLKPSIKIFHWYEFLLRFCNKGKIVYVIPKALYNHTLFKNDVDIEEAKFYHDLCLKEYWYEQDREKVYLKVQE
jgi:hypothetical protein